VKFRIKTYPNLTHHLALNISILNHNQYSLAISFITWQLFSTLKLGRHEAMIITPLGIFRIKITFPFLSSVYYSLIRLYGEVNSVKNTTMNIWLNEGVY